MPATSSPRQRPRSISRSASRREQPNLRLSGQSASRGLDEHADDHPRAGGVPGDLAELLLGVDGELLDAHGMRVRDVGGALDGVAEGDVARGHAEPEAEVDLAARGAVEAAAERRHRRHHLGGGVGLDRVVDDRVAEPLLERAVLRPHELEVEDHGRPVEVVRRGCRRPAAPKRRSRPDGCRRVVRARPRRRQRVACASPSVPGGSRRTPEFPKETLPSLREFSRRGPYRGACVGVVRSTLTWRARARAGRKEGEGRWKKAPQRSWA